MGVSVFVAAAPLRRNDYASFYAVKEELTGDQYRARYPVGLSTLSEEHRRDKDYIIKYDNDLYLVGDHREPHNPLGIAQFLNCAIRSAGQKNNSKLVKVLIDGKKMFVAKITARNVNVGQQLFTPYGRGFIIPKNAVPPSCPPTLRLTMAPSIPLQVSLSTCHTPLLPRKNSNVSCLYTSTSCTPTSDGSFCEVLPHTTTLRHRYGYSTDSLWEITMTLPSDRVCRRQLTSHIRNMAITEEEAVSYLLAIDENIFQLHIKSTNILYASTIGDGSCGFRALRQASIRAEVPIQLRSVTTIPDVDYTNEPQRTAQIAWTQSIIDGSAVSADISTLRIYQRWLQTPAATVRNASYSSHHQGVSAWMSTNDCHNLAATLPYIGLFTMVGHAILKKATYVFFTNSKTTHHGWT